MYYSFALAGHKGTCVRPLHIFALLFAFSQEIFRNKIRKVREVYIWPYCWLVLVSPIFMKLSIWGQFTYVIMCVKFLVDWLRGYGILTPPKLPFPNELLRRPYNSVGLSCDTVKYFSSEFSISTNTAQKVNICAWHFYRSICCDENLKKSDRSDVIFI